MLICSSCTLQDGYVSPLIYSLEALEKDYEKPGKTDCFNPLSISAVSHVQEMNFLGRPSETLFLPAYDPPSCYCFQCSTFFAL